MTRLQRLRCALDNADEKARRECLPRVGTLSFPPSVPVVLSLFQRWCVSPTCLALSNGRAMYSYVNEEVTCPFSNPPFFGVSSRALRHSLPLANVPPDRYFDENGLTDIPLFVSGTLVDQSGRTLSGQTTEVSSKASVKVCCCVLL